MPRTVAVEWEIATDEQLRTVVRRGTETASIHLGHSVHAQPHGLEPGRDHLTREEVGEPVGNSLNDNLIRELVYSTTLVPPDLALPGF